MRLWDDNIKMDIKEISFVFRLNSSLQQWKKAGFLETLMRLFCIKIKNLKKFCN